MKIWQIGLKAEKPWEEFKVDFEVSSLSLSNHRELVLGSRNGNVFLWVKGENGKGLLQKITNTLVGRSAFAAISEDSTHTFYGVGKTIWHEKTKDLKKLSPDS